MSELSQCSLDRTPGAVTLGSDVRPSLLLVAGPSASGKSTLCARVAAETGAKYLSLDSYWRPRGPRMFAEVGGKMVRNFEDPRSYDGERLAGDLAALAPTRACIAEGFCLLSYPEIRELTALRFYLDVPFEVCLLRRMARRPARPSDVSFRLIGKAEMLRTVIPQRDLPGVQILDGLRPVDDLVRDVLRSWASRRA